MNRPFASMLVACGCLVMVGCESIATRMKQRATVVSDWSPMTQNRIKRGEIKVGDDYNMVYVALGSPDEQDTFSVKDGGTVTIWSYSKIVQRFEREETVNYEDVSEYNVATGQRVHYQVPNRQKVFVASKERGMQVIFRHGRVTSVRWGPSQSSPPPTPKSTIEDPDLLQQSS